MDQDHYAAKLEGEIAELKAELKVERERAATERDRLYAIIEREQQEGYYGPVLDIRNLYLSYATRMGEIPAVIDFSLQVQPGEAVGLVGESGCGKSTVALAIMQYMGTNGSIVGGEIFFSRAATCAR
jgi:ABC-type multidrug transport system fused ATPase/permease subunit